MTVYPGTLLCVCLVYFEGESFIIKLQIKLQI